MLLLFHEYRPDHPRFNGHVRIAIVMALVVPLCASLIADAIGWFNPWLWSSAGVGIALALMLASVTALHRNPPGLSAFSRRRIAANDGGWFPYFFVLLQSSIASLIVLFLWFSATSSVLLMPLYAHVIVAAMALMIPARRLVSAHITALEEPVYLRRRELLRGIWHACSAVLITRIFIGITYPETNNITQGGILWQTMLWVPASLYILFSTAMMIEELNRINSLPSADNPPTPSDNKPTTTGEDRL